MASTAAMFRSCRRSHTSVRQSPATTSRRQARDHVHRRITFMVLSACVLVAVVPGCSRGDRPPGDPPFIAVDSDKPTDRAIASAQERLRAVPDDNSARLLLAQAF